MQYHGYKLQNAVDTLRIMYHLVKSKLSKVDLKEADGFDIVELAMLHTLHLIGLVQHDEQEMTYLEWSTTSKLKSLAYDSEEFLSSNRRAVVSALKESKEV